MRILKNKVSKALQQQLPADANQNLNIKVEDNQSSLPTVTVVVPDKKVSQTPSKTKTDKIPISKPSLPKQNGSTKNIVKNFGRAFATFALSDLSLNPLLKKYLNVNIFEISLFRPDFFNCASGPKNGPMRKELTKAIFGANKDSLRMNWTVFRFWSLIWSTMNLAEMYCW